MNEEETRQFREACDALVSGWKAWTDALRAGPRAGEGGYLPFDTAWECARIEYVLKRWRTTACDRAVEITEIRKALKEERTLRQVAGGARDEYKALWEERGRHLAYVNDVVLKAVVNERDEARSTLDTYEGANRELSKDREALRSLLVEVLSFFPAPHWTKGGTDGLVSSGSVLWSTLAKWRATVAEPTTDARRDPESANAKVESLRRALDDAICARITATGEPGAGTSGVLIARRFGSEIRDVSRDGQGRNIGRLVPYALGWNAYVYQPIGPEKFVGWYEDAENAAEVIDRRYPR